MTPDDHAKSAQFAAYVRHRKLIYHNEAMRRYHFVAYHKRRAEELEREYPDFPEAYERAFGK